MEADQTEKVENQQLGLIAESESFWSVSLNSNINIFQGRDVFELDKTTPSLVIQGHSVNFMHLIVVELHLESLLQ